MYLKESFPKVWNTVKCRANSLGLPDNRPVRTRYFPSQIVSDNAWLSGAVLALVCAVVYLALRPPLFDFDGYMYRLYALLPSRFYDINPHHLLWDPVQILLASVARAVGYPTTVPFQIFGIIVNCTTLFCFYLLLRNADAGAFFSGAAVVFMAFSPAFWYLGLQNHPYTVVFLAFVLYLHCWRAEGATIRWRWRLLAAAALTAVILFHQAVILLVPVAVVVLILFDREAPGRRLAAGLAWGAGVTAVVVGTYFCFWTYVSPGEGLLRWSAGYMESVHPVQLFQLGFPKSFARSVMGLSAALLQDAKIELFLEYHFSPETIFEMYAGAGLTALIGSVVIVLQAGPRRTFLRLIRSNALFAISLFSMITWWAFAFSWEAATAHYWVLSLFPALVCLGLLVRRSHRQRHYLAGAIVVLVSVWNVWSNVATDRDLSRNFPEPLVASIERYVGPHDIFIVFGNDEWFGNVNYILLFNCLRYLGNERGVAIFNDYIVPAPTSASWQRSFGDKIDSTLDSGGQVFLAAHVFDHETYMDLSLADDPFNEQVNTQYLPVDGLGLERDIQRFFANYKLEGSDLRVGSDSYFRVRRK